MSVLTCFIYLCVWWCCHSYFRGDCKQQCEGWNASAECERLEEAATDGE